MRKAGVPVVPGTRRSRPRDAAELAEFAARRGVPHPAQGLGRRRRQGNAPRGLARRSSRPPSRGSPPRRRASFGDGAVYAEKLIERPRHVEVQVVGGPHGNRRARSASASAASSGATRRWSRSARRRSSDEPLRQRLFAAALAAARAVGYDSCGTVEFLLAAGRLLLLPRDEHAAPGGAPGHRGGLGRRPRGRDDPDRRSASRCRFRREGLQARGPRDRVPRLRRGRPTAASRLRPGAIRALRLPEGPGVRNDVGRRIGLRRSDRLRPDARQARRARGGSSARDRAARAGPRRVRDRGRGDDAAALPRARAESRVRRCGLRRAVARSAARRGPHPGGGSFDRRSLAGGRDPWRRGRWRKGRRRPRPPRPSRPGAARLAGKGCDETAAADLPRTGRSARDSTSRSRARAACSGAARQPSEASSSACRTDVSPCGSRTAGRSRPARGRRSG